MKSCAGCLGKMVVRVLILIAIIVVTVYAVRVAWRDNDSAPKQWICSHAPTVCEAP
jgi:hypothetical protein